MVGERKKISTELENQNRWLESVLTEHQRLDREVAVAREIQISTLPSIMPEVPGYDVHGCFLPADHAGGDLFDLVLLEGQLFILLGDATGHGFGPALSATQMQAMLRVAFRCGANLDQAFLHVNNQLDEDLPDDRFITAFVGFLDPQSHQIAFHSAGQGPILHYQSAQDGLDWRRPTTFPLGAVSRERSGAAEHIAMAPGDWLLLLSDGVYEYENADGQAFGKLGVEAVIRAHPQLAAEALADKFKQALVEHAAGRRQDDDITMVLLHRQLEEVVA